MYYTNIVLYTCTAHPCPRKGNFLAKPIHNWQTDPTENPKFKKCMIIDYPPKHIKKGRQPPMAKIRYGEFRNYQITRGRFVTYYQYEKTNDEHDDWVSLNSPKRLSQKNLDLIVF